MDNHDFLHLIESSRDPDKARLDAAVRRGITRGKNEKWDRKKFLALAAACAFTVGMCCAFTLIPYTPLPLGCGKLLRDTGAAVSLSGRLKEMSDKFKLYYGGN